MAIRVAINGFGRIGRQAFKAGFGRKKLEFVAINDLASAEQLAYLLAHDSVYGAWPHKVSARGATLVIDGAKIPVLTEKDPAALPWKKFNVDVVIESTGRFTNEQDLKKHVVAGARAVILSAPAKGGDVPTFVRGVNDEKLGRTKILNSASCTTNCVAPIAAVLHETFGIAKAGLTTIHSYTADQALVDGPHKDFRRGRSAALNMVPTTTGAAIAVTETITDLRGKFDGSAIRVPTPIGSLSDFTFLLKKKTTVVAVNAALIAASKQKQWKGILECSTEPLVSQDIVGNSASAIVDLQFTQVIDGDLVKILAWYDNEWGYAHRLIEMVEKVG
ncbi:MAG: type I glyceraldehyde-3-phosphate dehydrogenase [Candidatus Magasanikbacteria bacterium RIFCSPHIGHO2_01_FULL_50_8]|uniref:Type I glyceraldehyde-3-phosphate dehydrogenase n=2 Tax=Candidatus Magasanikiibacteriota TaxID=1752731 RepID=A0A1F6LSC8_9BACT|nr:MAG: type I glyceraldehyde-3-phosphate dehydrogenase [Candidatus Magasanikbacteria bacterium RIFCSPHIGHO2_01_FULL_50_8]OGH67902.1 MAG: type I glyceraldehyde-3-phosphate dehydrogenase [Candidatus Magasanikbacteria bacterium RIFCSPHIGHO2_02_FULL_50_9b]